MFIAKNNDLIILVNNSREELEQALQFMVYTSIEETDEGYELYNGSYLTKEEIQMQEQERIAKEFFNTSLGYVKRQVTMATGDVRDFLFDIKPTLQVGVPIITYNLDGTQNRGVLVTEQFLKECEKQVYYDFYGTMPTTEENSVVENTQIESEE